jgi:hypothetical protein
MSIIKIKGRADPIFRPYEIAKKIKQRKFGDDTVSPVVPKASSNDLLDLGDEWSGSYGQVISIELNDKPRASQPQIEAYEPTLEERKKAQEAIRKIGEDLGFTAKGKKMNKLSLTRSSLNEYREKFGKEYKIPVGTEIIED